MPGRIVLYGATGYTGTLVAEHLTAAGVEAVFAGRSGERLQALVARLGSTAPVAVADAGNRDALRALLGEGDVLLTTVGPFATLGDGAVRAACDAGANYLDSTGEPVFIRRVFEEHGPRAERAGVVLLPAFGYDNVPGNVAGALALEEAGAAATQVDIGYFASHLRPSGGTFASLVGATQATGFAWRDGSLVSEAPSLRTASFDTGRRQASGVSFGGSENIALPRTYPRLRTVGTYLGWFGSLTGGVHALGRAQNALRAVPGGGSVVETVTAPLRRSRGGGPDAVARSRSQSLVVAVARDAGGAPLATVRLRGIDPYTLTARLLVWGAVQLRDGRAAAPGARGPVEAFGLATMVRALEDAGLPRVA